jgi:hypothetical protein
MPEAMTYLTHRLAGESHRCDSCGRRQWVLVAFSRSRKNRAHDGKRGVERVSQLWGLRVTREGLTGFIMRLTGCNHS